MFLLVVIHHLDVKRALGAFRPFKGQTPLLVDANAALSAAVAAERLKMIARQAAQIVSVLGILQNGQPLLQLLLERLIIFYPVAVRTAVGAGRGIWAVLRSS